VGVNRVYLMTLGLTIGLVAAFSATFVDVYRAWARDTYAGHVLFVPVFSAVMLWAHRDALRRAVAPGDKRGFLMLAAGAALLVTGRAFNMLTVQTFALAIAVAGGTLVLAGRTVTGRAGVPIAFLVLMAPPPRGFIDVVTVYLQSFAAAFAVGVLRLLDVPVLRAGVMLELPNARLEVAEICNGLRFLFALLVMTVAFAHITQRSAARKFILVASAVPIAILANAARVTVIAAGAYWVGPEIAGGAVHHMIGKIVWVLTLGPLALVAWALSGVSRPHTYRGPTTLGA
jgi:exosortase